MAQRTARYRITLVEMMMARRFAFALQIDPAVFAAHAEDNGWQALGTDATGPESIDEDRPSRTWRVPGGEVRFVDDTIVSVQYVEISAEPVEAVREAIATEFTCYDKDDCLEVLDFSQPEETVGHALRLLACTAPGEFDQRVADAAVEALQDDREGVRVDALSIVNYTRWTALLEQVRRVAAEDPSERVRGFAGNSKLILEAAAQL